MWLSGSALGYGGTSFSPPHMWPALSMPPKVRNIPLQSSLSMMSKPLGHPDVAARVVRVVAADVAVALQRVHPGRRRVEGAVVDVAVGVDVEVVVGRAGRHCRRLGDVRRHIDADRATPGVGVGGRVVAVEAAAAERDPDVRRRSAHRCRPRSSSRRPWRRACPGTSPSGSRRASGSPCRRSGRRTGAGPSSR